jgi:hypothetical protein
MNSEIKQLLKHPLTQLTALALVFASCAAPKSESYISVPIQQYEPAPLSSIWLEL